MRMAAMIMLFVVIAFGARYLARTDCDHVTIRAGLAQFFGLCRR